MACEDSIIAMDTGGVNGFCSLKQTTAVGIGASSAQAERFQEQRVWPKSVLCSRQCWGNRKPASFTASGSGIWITSRKVGKSGGNSTSRRVLGLD
jgi:hypothetical protein